MATSVPVSHKHYIVKNIPYVFTPLKMQWQTIFFLAFLLENFSENIFKKEKCWLKNLAIVLSSNVLWIDVFRKSNIYRFHEYYENRQHLSAMSGRSLGMNRISYFIHCHYSFW